MYLIIRFMYLKTFIAGYFLDIMDFHTSALVLLCLIISITSIILMSTQRRENPQTPQKFPAMKVSRAVINLKQLITIIIGQNIIKIKPQD